MEHWTVIKFRYIFRFSDGTEKTFIVELDPTTLEIRSRAAAPPGWARLDYHPCENCPLDPAVTAYCPVAVNLAPLVESFGRVLSYEEAKVIVETDERTVSKQTAVQEGLCSLMGLYMVSSGCPVLEKLRPMARFHLPFASVEETIYRAASMYLLAQYFRNKKGLPADWPLARLQSLYQEIKKVNTGLAQRLLSAAEKDAPLNAVALLDIFAIMLQEPTRDNVDTLESLFKPYLRPDGG
jgi:hypothetical protein